MIAAALTLLFAVQTPTQPTAPNDQHGLGEEVITGQVEFKIDDPKYFFTPLFDPFSPIGDLLTPNSYVFDDALYRTVDSMTIPGLFVRSSFLRVPLARSFLYGDIMVFMPTFESRVATWELVISNSLGETVRTIRRKGQPPALMSWDGRGDDGEPITTGEMYSFTFYAYDAHGNRTRIPGRPQRIDGMVHQHEDEWVISMAADGIFAPGLAVLADAAAARLDEAANVVKEHFTREVVVYVYSEQEKLSADRCAVVRDELARRIVLPVDGLKVAPRFIPGLSPKFSKIEVRVI